MKDKVERLMKDRAKYKAEIKKYKADIRSRIDEHRDELERNQEYFQEQIFSLTEERDELFEQVNLSRDLVFNEKERLRSEFGKKITAEKKRLESLYSSKNSATSVRLQETVDKLQERLNTQLEEKERIREEYETQMNLLAEQHRKSSEQSQEDIRKAQQAVDREREEIRRSTQLFQTEKETSIAILRREKNQEIQALIAEKDTVIQSLEFTLKNFQKEKELMEKDHNRAITDLNCTHELSLRERNGVINRLKDTHSRAMDQARTKYEGQITHLTEKATMDLEELAEKHRKEKVMMDANHTDMVKEVRNEAVRQIQELGNEVGTYKQRMAEVERDSKILIDKANNDAEELVRRIEKEKEQAIDILKREMSSEHQEAVKDRDDTIIELERLNHALGAQVGHYRSAMENMKHDTARIKQQFVSNLNKQKDEDDRAISERESRIVNLEAEIKTVHDRTAHQLNIAKQSIETLQYEKTDIETKLRASEEAHNDIQRRLEQAELQRSTIAGNYEKRIARIKQDFTTKMENVTTTESTKYQAELKQLQEKLATAEKQLDNMKVHYTQELNNQRRELLQHSEKESKTLRADLEKVHSNNATLTTTLGKDRKRFLLTMETESNKAKAREYELNKQLEQVQQDLKHSQSVIEANREQFSIQLNAMTGLTSPEKEELKRLKEDLALKDEQLDKLKAFSTDLTKKLNGMRTIIARSQNELAEEKEKMAKEKKELVLKDEQLEKLKAFSTDLKKQLNDMRTTIARSQNELAKEKEKMDKELKKKAVLVRDPNSEDKIRKMRDDCIEALRKNNIELNVLKQENLAIKREVINLEKQLREKEEAYNQVCGTIANKTARITELESMLSDAVRKLISTD
jgi:hypothetical protein